MNKTELETESKKLLENISEYKLDESTEVEYLQGKIAILKFTLENKDEEFTQAWNSRELDFEKKIDKELHKHQSLTRCIEELKKFSEENKKMKELCAKYQEILAEADYEIQKRNLILESLDYDMSKLEVEEDGTSN